MKFDYIEPETVLIGLDKEKLWQTLDLANRKAISYYTDKIAEFACFNEVAKNLR